jgi:NAD(P) transhydrogenase subunit beta
MSLNVVALLYLVASVCFIQALKGLSHPTSSIRGNLFGMTGMGIAVVTTAALIFKLASMAGTSGVAGMAWVLLGLLVGGTAGALMAKRVEMTKMPELVAFMHSMIGLAAVFIGIAAVAEPHAFGIAAPGDPIPAGNRLELFLGAAIGAITFSGSVIAFGKLSGKYKFRLFQGAPVTFGGQHLLNLVLGLCTIALGLTFMFTESWAAFFLMLAFSFVLGVLIIIPIGGADMPVVVSMLNSYSGWAAAGIGFSLNNSMLIIAGSLVGSSGAILSYIMCKAMNRSFFNVILGGFGGEASSAGRRRPGAAPREERQRRRRRLHHGQRRDGDHRAGLRPGGGARAARGQRAGREADAQGREREVRDPPGGRAHAGAHERAAGRGRGALRPGVRDGGHQRRVRAGRRGHRPRRQRRGEPGRAAEGTPIYGMPILEAYKAKTVIVNKRSMAAGYAGLDNELFYMDKTMMVFGDAKKVVEDMVKAVE